MKYVMAVVLALSLVLTAGCEPPGMNVQRASLRGSGDISVSAALDAVKPAEKAAEVQQKTKEIAEAIRLFLKTGKVADLTIPEITTELEKIIPVNYRFLLEIAIAQIDGVTVPVQVIGTNNVRRIDSFCVGLINGCNEYSMDDRPPPNEAEVATRSLEAPEATFGRELKKEAGIN